MRAHSPYTGIVVYTHNSITSKNLIHKYLGLMHDFDPFLSDIYVSDGDVNKEAVINWCRKNGVNHVLGTQYADGGNKQHLHKLVLYIGSTTHTDTFKIAHCKSRQLGCDLLILP